MTAARATDRSDHRDIRIGALAHASRDLPNYLRQILPHGFESIQLTFGHHVGDMLLQQVAERIRVLLCYVPADKLWLNPDCGFWETPRWATRLKMAALVEGTRLVRAEL